MKSCCRSLSHLWCAFNALSMWVSMPQSKLMKWFLCRCSHYFTSSGFFFWHFCFIWWWQLKKDKADRRWNSKESGLLTDSGLTGKDSALTHCMNSTGRATATLVSTRPSEELLLPAGPRQKCTNSLSTWGLVPFGYSNSARNSNSNQQNEVRILPQQRGAHVGERRLWSKIRQIFTTTLLLLLLPA